MGIIGQDLTLICEVLVKNKIPYCSINSNYMFDINILLQMIRITVNHHA